jgi:hypothetical protein
MKIVRLTAEAFQRLTAVEIEPDGSLVIVAGRNAQGKTSVLDAIEAALSGRAASKIKKPIKDGETRARVELVFEDFTVERSWSASGSKLKVTSNAAGRLEYPSPQKMLDSFLGKLSFDPLDFANADPKAQVATLLSVVDLPFDPVELDRQRQEAYDQRTIVNREVKALQARVDALPRPPKGTSTTEVDVVALAEALRRIETADQMRGAARQRYHAIKVQIEALQVEMAEVAESGRETNQGYLDLVGANGTPDEIKIKIELAAEANRAVYAAKQREEMLTQLRNSEAESALATKRITECDARKADGLAGADLPYPGLSFDNDGVLLDGIPFDQSSGAERLKVSLAIALRLNPEIKVVRITDGSLLDESNMQVLREMIPEDSQVWIERVGTDDEMAVIIEDGSVA